MFPSCMAFVVALLVLILIRQGISQPNNTESEINITTPIIRSYCGLIIPPIFLSNFLNNRNSTLAEIRRKISFSNVFYARAQSSAGGELPAYGAFQCRNYLSAAQCVACFDAAVSQLFSCMSDGAYVFLDNCFLRYESGDYFYNDPNLDEGRRGTPRGICSNKLASQRTTNFSQVVNDMFSDIKDATPKTSNFYVASTRHITSENATVYAIAQCVENINKASCQDCITTAFTDFSNCLPNYTQGRFINMACFARYSETPFFNDNQTTDITNLLKGHSSKVPVIAIVVGGIGFLFIMILVLLLRLWKKSKKMEADPPDLKGPKNFSYKDLKLATNNFSDENILGKGGFGEVYKAVVDDTIIVAVKKIKVGHAKAKEEFENEVKLICNIHHREILRLLGWSSEGSSLLLILEYMPNGSLDRFLWGAKRGTLNWKQRYNIIFGVARGLAHLHKECHVKIIHRDIKSSNILLDNDFQPKIADFGLARFQPEDQSHVRTKFAGTLGYTAPEYALGGLLSDKADTYSFGIVVLEIISGRRCTDMNLDRPSTDYLLEHAWKLYENKKHIMLTDETMDLNKNEEEHMMQIIEIALLCTQSQASNRPTMSEVVSMLPYGLSLQYRKLIRPTFNDHHSRVLIGSKNKPISIGDVS